MAAYLEATGAAIAGQTTREQCDERHRLRRLAGVSGDEDWEIVRRLERERS